MKKIILKETNNGYIISVEGFLKNNGEYVYDNANLNVMLSTIGEQILDHKVKIELK